MNAPLADLTRSALEVLSAFGRASSEDTMHAMTEAIRAGGAPAIAVVATHEGMPEVVLCIRSPDGVLLPVATVHPGIPAERMQ